MALVPKSPIFYPLAEVSREDAHAARAYLQRAELRAGASDGAAATPRIMAAGVIGAGTMGIGIAAAFLMSGAAVRLFDAYSEVANTARQKIDKILKGAEARGKLAPGGAVACLERLQLVPDLNALADCQVAVEAVIEDADVKASIFKKLGSFCPDGTLLASNTSSLDIDALAEASGRPGQVLGLHFFSPAHIMKLLEIVRGKATSGAALATALALADQLGKKPVVVGNADGFAANRTYHRYLRQAYFLLEEGAFPEDVDRVLTAFGFAMGPFAVGDLAGLDIGYGIRQRQRESVPSGQRWPVIADQVCEAGRLGQKTGAGWYRYDPDERTPVPDPAVRRLIEARSAEMGVRRREIGEREVLERCLLALINEGARILAEGLIQRPSDLDVIWRYGYGFPDAHGGPMYLAAKFGPREIEARLAHWRDVSGDDLLTPAPSVLESAFSRMS